MSSPAEEIKSRLDLVEFIQSYVRLQKAGINYKALCPFHAEKTPSFFVSPSRQIWHCFGGCQKGGDIFKFVMEIEGLDFPEALRLLAQRAGVVLKREDPSIRSERNRLYDLCEEATKIFEKSLTLTSAAKSYLQKRGITDSTIKDFKIGFAPQSWDYLLKALGARGFKPEDVEKAGLAIKSQEGNSWYDRFRSRIIFPVIDGSGRVVGFSGRIFDQTGQNDQSSRKAELGQLDQIDQAKRFTKQNDSSVSSAPAKYINTPQTLIYDKSRVLYGFDKAKDAIRSKNQVVVVEGQMDCIMSHQAGVKNTVAVSGTAFTAQQLKVLRRLCETLICSFDTDSAGESATKRSLSLAAEFEFERRIAAIPSGKDPADTVLENPEAWQKTVEEAHPVVEFYFAKALRDFNPSTVEGKKAIASLLLPYLAELTNEIEKAHWVRELASRLSLPEETVWKELLRQKKQTLGSVLAEEKPADQPLLSRIQILEERLLSLLAIVDGALRDRLLAGREVILSSAGNQDLFYAMTAATSLEQTYLKERLALLHLKGEIIADFTEDLEEELSSCLEELEGECIREELKRLNNEIANQERRGNQAVVTSLLENFRTLSQKLKKAS